MKKEQLLSRHSVLKKVRHQLQQFSRNKIFNNFTNYHINFICAIKFYKLLQLVLIR